LITKLDHARGPRGEGGIRELWAKLPMGCGKEGIDPF